MVLVADPQSRHGRVLQEQGRRGAVLMTTLAGDLNANTVTPSSIAWVAEGVAAQTYAMGRMFVSLSRRGQANGVAD